MVEEAGEILEAHVLTSLGPNTEHLIMIGEHKCQRDKPLSPQWCLCVCVARVCNANHA